MVMYLYSTHITVFWQFIVLLWGDIGRQHVKAPLAVVINTYFDLTHPPTQPTHKCKGQMKSDRDRGRPPHRDYVLYSFRTVCGLFNVPQIIRNKCCETGPMVYRPYPRRLESLSVCRCHYKGNFI